MAENDNTLNLLKIADTLDDINDEDVSQDKDYGMNYNYLAIGMSGSKMVDSLNSNFQNTDAQFLAHQQELEIRIISNTIKGMKSESGTLYYTLNNETWIPIQSMWGDIKGEINDQEDLKAILDKFAYQDEFDNLAEIVSTSSEYILSLQTDLGSLTDIVSSLSDQINGVNGILVDINSLKTSMTTKISSNDIKQFRIFGNAVQYTTDGVAWTSISSAGTVEWGSILGDINNQADLVNFLNHMSEGAIAEFRTELNEVKETVSTYDQQITDLQNTTTSLANQILNLNLPVYISEVEYNRLVESGAINENTIYIVNDNLIKLVSLAISGPQDISVGYAYSYTIIPTPATATDIGVEWSIDSSDYAEMRTDGTLTAKRVGTVNITATSTSNPAIKSESTIEINPVTDLISLDSFELNEDTYMKESGYIYAFSNGDYKLTNAMAHSATGVTVYIDILNDSYSVIETIEREVNDFDIDFSTPQYTSYIRIRLSQQQFNYLSGDISSIYNGEILPQN